MKTLIYLFTLTILITSCNNSKNKANENRSSNYDHQKTSAFEEYEEEGYQEESTGYDDGTYSATVDYYNPETGYSATYTLDVEVEDNEVTVIYFPNDGYLDEDHIWSDELDSNGFVSIDGENGKTYDIQIDY